MPASYERGNRRSFAKQGDARNMGSTQSGDESVDYEAELRGRPPDKPRRRHVKSGAERKPRNDYSMETRLLAVERFIRGEWTDRDGIQEMGIAATSWKNWKRAYQREKDILSQFPFLSKRKRIRSSADGNVSLSAPRSRGERIEREAYSDLLDQNMNDMSGEPTTLEVDSEVNKDEQASSCTKDHPRILPLGQWPSQNDSNCPTGSGETMETDTCRSLERPPASKSTGFAVLAAGVVLNGDRQSGVLRPSSNDGTLYSSDVASLQERFSTFFDRCGPLAFIVLDTPNEQKCNIAGLKGWLMPLPKFEAMVDAEAVNQVYEADID